MARISRPPGFDMTYRPVEVRRFGPPMRVCLPAYLYMALAVTFSVFLAYGRVAPPGSMAYRWVVEASSQRSISPLWFALLVLASGVAALIRTHMRGVVIYPDGIETLEVLALGWPRIRKIEWALIDRFRFDASPMSIVVELWNGQQHYLPQVTATHDLVNALCHIAQARAIPYTGGVL